MAQYLSEDLRIRVIRAVEGGMLYRPSEILLMLQGRKRSDERDSGRRYQAMDGEAEISARH